jgi:hypothetical protein
MKEYSRLAYPQLDLPVFQHVAIFRAVEKVLRTDRIFPRACSTFLSWRGTNADTWEPSFALCPYCRISPWPGGSNMATERQHNAPLIIAAEMAVIGTDFDNIGNFWGLVFNAIWSQADLTRFHQVTTMLLDAGVNRPVMTMQGFGTHPDTSINTDNNLMMVATGHMTFNSLLPK